MEIGEQGFSQEIVCIFTAFQLEALVASSCAVD